MEHHIHGGDIYRNVITHDFSINLNPLGMPKEVQERLKASVKDWDHYPDPECGRLRELLAAAHGIEAGRICCGNGAAELIWLLVQAKRPKKALLLAPTFFEYEHALRSLGCKVEYLFLNEEDGFVPDMEALCGRVQADMDMVFFCNPNNPTGIPVSADQIEELAKACHQNHAFLVVDECFCEFLDRPEDYSSVRLTAQYPQMVILRAFTKTFAMAGLRLGYGICGDAGLWEQIGTVRQPWSVSLPAQEAGIAALEAGNCREYLEHTRELLRKERPALKEGLQALGLTVFDSRANYLLFRVPREAGETAAFSGAESLYEQCRRRGILIRDCKNFVGLTVGYYRVCVRGREENSCLLRQLAAIGNKHKTKERDGDEFISNYSGG